MLELINLVDRHNDKQNHDAAADLITSLCLWITFTLLHKSPFFLNCKGKKEGRSIKLSHYRPKPHVICKFSVGTWLLLFSLASNTSSIRGGISGCKFWIGRITRCNEAEFEPPHSFSLPQRIKNGVQNTFQYVFCFTIASFVDDSILQKRAGMWEGHGHPQRKELWFNSSHLHLVVLSPV